MHLHAARMTARQDGSGGLLLLEEQNRALWDREGIQAGLGVVGQIRTRRSVLPIPRGGRDRGGTLPRPLVSGDSLGRGGGVLLVAGTDRTLRDTQTESCRSGCRVARTRRGTRRSRWLRAADLAGRLLSLGCGAGRPASALRKRPDGDALSRGSVRIGSHSGSEGAFAATTRDRRPRLIKDANDGPRRAPGVAYARGGSVVGWTWERPSRF